MSIPQTPPDPLAQCGQSGIYRIAGKDRAALQAAAAKLGFAYFDVDLKGAANVPGFIEALRRDLGFPDWFGGNLDAVNDCLTDFSWRPAAGYVITMSGSARLATNATSFAALNEVLSCAVEAWQSRDVPFWVFYVADDRPPEHGEFRSRARR
jgi:hypothetical protein